jgi:16S rRNA A1518/A1519 N6-dimethyltransferase RsmA/KsgA/DIM1 with predicted DNA glycosylase/AP lyase activity
VLTAMQAAAIDPDARAETLGLEEFDRLTATLHPHARGQEDP